MKKSQLIALLNNIPGDPEIVFWNGYVDDWMPIAPNATMEHLVKMTEEFLFDTYKLERWGQTGVEPTPEELEEFRTWAKEDRKKAKWDLPNPYVKPEDLERWYGKKRKTILILHPQARGLKMTDRIGEVGY